MTYRNTAIPSILKICTALRFLATGSYQQGIGNDIVVGLSQPMVSVVLAEFLNVMEQFACADWIQTAMTDAEVKEAKYAFFSKCGIPGVIGAIDGTHVKIISPGLNTKHAYYNRKGYYSLNVLVVSIII